ncbi:MAG: GDP-mannose 4,6-dehydratase [Deltaproteobacteria bacterium]|nr:GDP-mannose 4,6-dehydratase [Deltaproteobacteria bacterium]
MITKPLGKYGMNKSNVLITGCTGLLGSWLTIRLVEKGANVIGLVRDLIPKSNLYLSGFHNRIEVVRGTLTDYELLLRIINEYEIETIFHLGAQTIVTIANRSPLSTFESNIKGTWNLLEAAKQTGIVKKLVIASSDKAYGDHDQLPYDEDYPLQGRHPYDVSKSCVDLIAQSYYATYKMPIAIARCGNIYGGGDLNFNRIIPGTIRSLYYNERPIIRSDGTPRRDYLYVEDAVQAYLALAKGLDDEELWGHPFNFSSENPVTVLDMVHKIINSFPNGGRTPEIIGKGKQKAEIHEQFLSSKKAKRLLNWQTENSLEKGISETIKWFIRFFDNDKYFSLRPTPGDI